VGITVSMKLAQPPPAALQRPGPPAPARCLIFRISV